MICQAIFEISGRYPVQMLCDIAKVSRSGYYRWLRRQRTPSAKEISDLDLLREIIKIYSAHKATYGYRRVHLELQSKGYIVNHKRVQRLMTENSMLAKIRVKRPWYGHGERMPAEPNLLNRRFYPIRPNLKWVTDLTQFTVGGIKRYLACVIDLYNGAVIGWSVDSNNMTSLAIAAISMAARGKDTTGTMIHSDQGSQFNSKEYRSWVTKHGMIQSMSRKGNCYDNSRMESFFGFLKEEMFLLFPYTNVETLERSISQYIAYYNSERIMIRSGKPPITVEYIEESLVT